GVGFVRDVLGASEAAAESAGFDTLARAGFDADEIAAARRHALGSGRIDGHAAFRAAEDVGLDERLAMALALEPFLCAPPVAAIPLPFSATPADAARAQAAAAASGVRAIRLARE